MPKQPDPGCQRDKSAEINQRLAARKTLGHWLPYHGEIPLLRPKIPSATMVVAKTTSPTLAIRTVLSCEKLSAYTIMLCAARDVRAQDQKCLLDARRWEAT